MTWLHRCIVGCMYITIKKTSEFRCTHLYVGFLGECNRISFTCNKNSNNKMFMFKIASKSRWCERSEWDIIFQFFPKIELKMFRDYRFKIFCRFLSRTFIYWRRIFGWKIFYFWSVHQTCDGPRNRKELLLVNLYRHSKPSLSTSTHFTSKEASIKLF